MTQPPIPPPDGSEPGERGGSPGSSPPGADDPTRKLRTPGVEGQRDPTRQFDQPQGRPPGQSVPGQPPYGQRSGPLPYPEYGQGPSGEPHHGPPPQGQPPQGQPYGQPQYGQAPYGQPQYGQPQYPQYGQPPYGAQAWGPPGGQPPTRNTTIVLTVGGFLLLAVLAAGLFFLMRGGEPGREADSSTSPSGAGTNAGEGVPPATVTPDGLGNDPELDQLAQDCYDGEMQACDDLYQVAELDSLYGIYGGTCAGRQDISDADTIFCTIAFPED